MNQRLDVGNVISRAFGIYGEQAGTLLPIAFVLFLIVGVVQGLVSGALLLIGTVVSLIATTLFQGIVTRLVEDVQDGRRDYTAGELASSVTPVLFSLIIAGIVVGILTTIGFIIIIVPGLIALAAWSVVGPVIVVEQAGPIQAMGRSWALVKDHFWPTLAIVIISFLIVLVVGIVFGVIAAAAGGSTVVDIVLRVVSSTVTAPIAALIGAVLYFELRGTQGQAGPTAASGGPAEPGATPPPPPPPPAAAPAG